MKSCIVVILVTYLIFGAVGQRKRQMRASKKVTSCSALRTKIPSLVSTNQALRSQLLKCKQKLWCPREGPDGVYNITIGPINASKEIKAPCKSCGWMLIQKRFDGSTDFNRSWTEYKNGFGDIGGEFFIGLEKLHLITDAKQCELFIAVRGAKGPGGHARYDNFKVGSEKEAYALKTIGNYSGTAGDALIYHEKMKFTTYDRHNDFSKGNCAISHNSGWWFKQCSTSSLNAKWYKDGIKLEDGLYGIGWGTLTKNVPGSSHPIIFCEMMIKPKSCRSADKQ
ncbi:angiopoietin-related protein 1-like [Drosophila biarmipes]|uniref:angiopoietin-related protein 1-like n=1 Tax=Drosophila biarmipes TaxID=125945 RepID=UPI0007E6212E|nr:angiopoietin-related protein 1-like [Drosophila biarmipes]